MLQDIITLASLIFSTMFLKKCLFILLALPATLTVHSQIITRPNYGLKSHETLEIKSIQLSRDKTVVNFSIENKIENGSFCADRNIYITDPSGTRIKLIKATGIPVCPKSYQFKAAGEKLDFSLAFPPLSGEPGCIDIKEECSDNCFSFYGVVLDEYVNSRLDEGFSFAERGELQKALDTFLKYASGNVINNGVRALVYYNIVKLAGETGNSDKAAEWYKKLNSSAVKGGKNYIKQLNLQGIKY